MSLPKQPQSMLIIGGGPIGLEFGYFYNAIGTKVTLVELLDRILPGEDEEVSGRLEKSLPNRGLTIHTGSKTGKVEKTANGSRVELETPKGPKDGRGRGDAGLDRRAGQCRGALRRQPEGRDRQEPHQGRPRRTATSRACRESTPSAT